MFRCPQAPYPPTGPQVTSPRPSPSCMPRSPEVNPTLLISSGPARAAPSGRACHRRCQLRSSPLRFIRIKGHRERWNGWVSSSHLTPLTVADVGTGRVSPLPTTRLVAQRIAGATKMQKRMTGWVGIDQQGLVGVIESILKQACTEAQNTLVLGA